MHLLLDILKDCTYHLRSVHDVCQLEDISSFEMPAKHRRHLAAAVGSARPAVTQPDFPGALPEAAYCLKLLIPLLTCLINDISPHMTHQ